MTTCWTVEDAKVVIEAERMAYEINGCTDPFIRLCRMEIRGAKEMYMDRPMLINFLKCLCAEFEITPEDLFWMTVRNFTRDNV